jgi:hypothetical protein
MLMYPLRDIPEGNFLYINKLQEKEKSTFLHCLNGGFMNPRR